jgi:hypothetical protein
MANTSATSIGGGSNTDILGLTLQSATNTASPAVTIDRMVVTWTKPTPARTLQVIRIGNSNVWTGSSSSPANCDITNQTLTTATATVTRLRFSGSMVGTTNVTVQFVMTDGTTKTVVVYPASNNFTFTVKSTGKLTGSNVFRTIQADYNLMPSTPATARLENYREINTEITP